MVRIQKNTFINLSYVRFVCAWKQQLGMITIAVASLVFCSSTSVRAELLWGFSYTDIATGGSLISATGTLTTSDIFTPNIAGVGGYAITGISGQRNGLAITGLVPNPIFPVIE